MIAIRSLLFFLFALMFAALVGCGGSGGGGEASQPAAPTQEPPPGEEAPPPAPPPPADVTVDQLSGTWFGSFDDNKQVRTFQFTVDAGNMSAITIGGTPQPRLSGAITKATEVPRAFRFVINEDGNQLVTGMMVVDPSGTYMLYVHDNSQVGVLQKGATALPTFAQTDIDGTWTGDTVSTPTGFSTLTRQDSNATCAPTQPAATPPTSQCTITLGATTRTASNVQLDDPAMGRFIGTFTDDPPGSNPPVNVAIRPFLSADKSFAGVWACTDFLGGFPQTCDFSAWKKQ